MATKRTDGRLVKKFRVNGKQYYVYGHTKKELAEAERKKRNEIEAGIEERENPTVQQYIDMWLEDRRLHLKESTYRGQRQILNVISRIRITQVGKSFGAMKMADVKPADMKQIQRELLKERKTQTTNDYMSLIGHVFRDAVKEDVIDRDPTQTVSALRRTETKARDAKHRALTIQEQTDFFECDRTKSSHYYNVYRLAVSTGMRVGEIGALKYSDIKGGKIHITKTITRTDSGSYVVGDTPKTDAGNRKFPITPKIAEIIEDQKRLNEMCFGNVVGMDDLLFRAVEGGLLMSTPINREIKRICKITGIEDFSMHGFRSTFCTRAIEGGMNPKTLQELAGHSSFNITMSLYGHCTDDTAADEMSRISIIC